MLIPLFLLIESFHSLCRHQDSNCSVNFDSCVSFATKIQSSRIFNLTKLSCLIHPKVIRKANLHSQPPFLQLRPHILICDLMLVLLTFCMNQGNGLKNQRFSRCGQGLLEVPEAFSVVLQDQNYIDKNMDLSFLSHSHSLMSVHQSFPEATQCVILQQNECLRRYANPTIFTRH